VDSLTNICITILRPEEQTFRTVTVIQLTFPDAYRGLVMSERYTFAIGDNFLHQGYLYEGIVYCVVYPEGRPEEEWIEGFYANGRRCEDYIG